MTEHREREPLIRGHASEASYGRRSVRRRLWVALAMGIGLSGLVVAVLDAAQQTAALVVAAVVVVAIVVAMAAAHRR
jgi:hypothetical protein